MKFITVIKFTKKFLSVIVGNHHNSFFITLSFKGI